VHEADDNFKLAISPSFQNYLERRSRAAAGSAAKKGWPSLIAHWTITCDKLSRRKASKGAPLLLSPRAMLRQ